MSVTYRPDIDGLRALAVLGVVLYHAGVPLTGGGFTGVDIFFVISGYLITANIVKDRAAGRFSLAAFYERRVRRILPAFFAMTALTTVAACIVLLPEQLRHYGGSMVSSVLFTANIYFHGKTGYFDAPAADKPLLHVWSLAVEEQFYMVFPLLLLGAFALAARKGWMRAPLWLAGGLALGSFILAELAVRRLAGDPTLAFYMMPWRIWEFMLGALLALRPLPQPGPRWREVPAALGLLLITASMALYTHATPFPGAGALPPVAGAALVIWFGKGTLTGRLLATPLLVGIGLISYSLYLWHWPLLVLPQAWAAEPLDMGTKLAWMGLAMAAAYASWRWVETPVRTRRILPTRRRVLIAMAACALLLIAAGIGLKSSKGWPQRLPAQVRALDHARTSSDPRRHECFKMNAKLDKRDITPATACVYGAMDVTPTWALWGDSHASSLVAPLGALAAQHGTALRFYGMSGCMGLPGAVASGRPEACEAFNQAVMAELRARAEITTIVLMSRHAGYVLPLLPSHGLQDAARENLVEATLNNPSHSLKTQAEKLAYFGTGLQSLLEELVGMGKRVVLFYPVPEPGRDVPSLLAMAALRGQDPAQITTPRQRHDTRVAPITAALDALDPRRGELVRVRPDAVLCDDTACHTYMDGKALYYDDHHLSLDGGARVVAPLGSLMRP